MPTIVDDFWGGKMTNIVGIYFVIYVIGNQVFTKRVGNTTKPSRVLEVCNAVHIAESFRDLKNGLAPGIQKHTEIYRNLKNCRLYHLLSQYSTIILTISKYTPESYSG